MCANKQSTDWFSAISRTLNWNQRERQKSFVMVEESAKDKPSRRRSVTPGKTRAIDEFMESEETIQEEDGDEEEDDKFDIDDLSGTDTDGKAKCAETPSTPKSEKDWDQHDAEVAAEALSKGNPYLSRVASSKSGIESGVDSPDRFVGPHPHPPKVSPRHVQWAKGDSPDSATSGDSEPGTTTLRPSHSLLRERLNRLEPGDSVKTPTLHGHFGRGTVVSNHRGRSKSKDANDVERRTFAVRGHDESDSNASDNES